jgi:hypothetical protein
MSSPVQNITSPLLSCSDNLRAAAQCSGLEEIFDRSLSLNDIASPSGAWTVAFKRSLRAQQDVARAFAELGVAVNSI